MLIKILWFISVALIDIGFSQQGSPLLSTWICTLKLQISNYLRAEIYKVNSRTCTIWHCHLYNDFFGLKQSPGALSTVTSLFSSYCAFIRIINKSWDWILFLKEHGYERVCVLSCAPAGNPVSSDQLEGSWLDHLWRVGFGGHLSCPEGKEYPYTLPLREDATHNQEKRGTLCLQDPHLSTVFGLFISDVTVWKCS